MKKQFGAFVALGLLIFIAAACSGSFTTANISELKFGRNDKAEPAATTFETGEDIYALAVVSNASGKSKLTWRISYDNVKGKDKGEEVGTKDIEFEGSKQLWQQFSSPLPGEYKVEATLFDDTGKQIDQKTGMVTITGTAPASAPPSNKTKEDEDGE